VVVAPGWTSALPEAQLRESTWQRLRTAVRRRVYLPACLIAALAVVIIAVGWSIGWGGDDYGGSVSALRVVVLGPASLAAIGVIMIVERVRPAQRRPLVARGHRQDALFTLLNISLVVPLITALTLSFVAIARRIFPWIVLPRMAVVPRWAIIAAIFVGMDFCNWLVHLANHRNRTLWRFHELHHSQEDLNTLSVFRTHPLIHVSYMLAIIPGTVLLANGALSASLLVVYGGIVAFAHSNTNLGFGPLGRVFVSPNFHRIHHRLEGAQDVNLGFTLTIWDQLARRAVFPTRDTVRIDTGLPGRPLTVEQSGPRARHFAVLGAQLAGPFRPMPAPVDLPTVRASTEGVD